MFQNNYFVVDCNCNNEIKHDCEFEGHITSTGE